MGPGGELVLLDDQDRRRWNRAEIEEGRADRKNNLLTNAPHTLEQVISDSWDRPYPRERAAYPTRAVRQYKVWPTVGRIDSAYGDRNLMCSCPPVEA